jgi:anaerobic magnesium-protoporphyrin IX monomethyl ester cyclase
VSYPIKNTGYFEKVSTKLVIRGSWAQNTDRDFQIAGRHSRRYYGFADQWLRNEVQAARLEGADPSTASVHRAAAAQARADLVSAAHEIDA